MDFFNVATKELRGGTIEVAPNFLVCRSQDLMVRGRSFYAIWDEERKLWSTDEYDVQRLVDREVAKVAEKIDAPCTVKYLRDFGSDKWAQFRKYVSNVSDNAHILDSRLVFANEETTKKDFATKKLPYSLEEGESEAWEILMSTLYAPEERAKIEWAIGAILTGDSKDIQKFIVLYGKGGTGKSTILNVIQALFEGYAVVFDAKSLGSTNSFSAEIFSRNPLVAVQHDGDLSRIEDNTKLNSIISHEEMLINEKYKSAYTAKFHAFLFMGTNSLVRISDAKSGLIRRLIDVQPTGDRLDLQTYNICKNQVMFDLGKIARHCRDVYLSMGKDFYDDYRPIEMMYKTDHVLNFVTDFYDLFKDQPYTSMKQAYDLYVKFCEDYGIKKPMSRQALQAELANYFKNYHQKLQIDGETHRNVFTNFSFEQNKPVVFDPQKVPGIKLDYQESYFDKHYGDCPAQLANDDGTPMYKWENVKTSLSNVNTSKLHYVRVPKNHIVIDFDLKNESGEKDLLKNIAAAEKWPPTYTEVSKSGNGIHLHYIYEGDVSQLSNIYAPGIEIKVYQGKTSLRRKLTVCNNHQISSISSGLPFKEKKMLNEKVVQSEKGLRDLISRNLRKEIHPSTKSSVDFIYKILEDAYTSGIPYDVSDMRSAILIFAQRSTNHSLNCMKLVQKMKFKSEEESKEVEPKNNEALVFYDVEVYPNLFLVCWKYQGSEDVVRMINPTPQEVETLFNLKLVGFNNRRYDNHILYGRYMGYDNQALYDLSQRIISGDQSAMFGAAYNLSYADIYDYSSKKQSLKKFEIALGIDHMEMDIPWDKPVPEDRIQDVVKYCVNDVKATEAVFDSRKADFTARLILSDLSGLTPNQTTQKHTAKIIFGDTKNPQKDFVYTDLSEMFPGYVYDFGKSTYRGEVVGEGGYVYAEPGIYENVAVLDVASMHPTSIEQLNLFGEHTSHFADLKAARVAIKHKDYDAARKMLGGKLAPYLKDDKDAKELSYALKIVINIVYGLTSAKFDNPFRDPRNKDNIVAKRGALFMINLKHEVQKRGFQVVHIKTDSIKIPNPTPEIIEFVSEYGKQYGYDFEHESTYDKFCLVNDAVYIAREGDHWEAVGAQFQHPYVFKKLFSGEDITFDDYCETKNVSKGAIYIDTQCDVPMALAGDMRFVGKTGKFVPVKEGYGGGTLYRVVDGKNFNVSGSKGYLWVEAMVAEQYGLEAVDTRVAEHLVTEAKKTIEKYGNFEEFVK